MPDVALHEIVERLGGELIGDGATRIAAIGALDADTPATISFLANPMYAAQLPTSRVACVVVAPAAREVAVARGAAIVTSDPYAYFARLTQWWAAQSRVAAPAGVHASAVVDADATVAADASVGAFAVVEAGAIVGAGAVLGAHAYVGRGARIGAATRLAPRASVLDGCSIGARCVLHSGVVVGADGFGFAPSAGRFEKIEQLGTVVVGDDVEIGANTCIDRGALGDTVIEDGVKLDNLIQVAHNVRIGAHTVIAACTGISGSTVIGARCMIGGGVGFSGHIRIADGTQISGGTQVSRSIVKPGFYSGTFPFDDNASWEKNAATLRNLYALRERVRALEKKTR